MGLNILLIGPPGSGKSTAAREIQKRYGAIPLSSGDMLREAVKKGDVLGKKLQEIMDTGAMAPDEILVEMISSRLKSQDCQNGFILDGFPRNLRQAELLEEILRANGQKLDTVIEIKVDEPVVIERICGRFSCSDCGEGYHKIFKQPAVADACDDCGAENSFVKRSDDSEAIVKARFKLYQEKTTEILSFYKASGPLSSIDGNHTPDKTASRIFRILDTIKSSAKPVRSGPAKGRK